MVMVHAYILKTILKVQILMFIDELIWCLGLAGK